MASTRKITVSLPNDLAAALADDPNSPASGNVSAFVAQAVREKLARDEVLGRLHELWGDLDPALVARAEGSLREVPR